ncbi:MAG: transporter substrate-binding domain-containing protein [Campylobacterales bacterium]|nr:transporter substrate-binding domain-containing protein [Campylobacterales bacterium]
MKKIFLLLFVAKALFASVVVEIVGDKNYPPYSYEESGEARGVYVDIIKSAFEKIDGYDVKFNMTAFKRAKELVKSGKAVAFFPPYYNEERTKWTKFSEPILAERSIVFAKSETLKNNVDFPKDFYGLTLCMNRGFNIEAVGGSELNDAVESKKINFIEANDNKACLSRVVRGMADFYVNDELIDISNFVDIKRGLKVKENFGHVGFTLNDKDYPYLKDFQKKFDKVIIQMKKDHEIEEIVKKYR